MSFTSMVIGNLYLMDAIVMPYKTDAPLFVNADAVLPLPVTAQLFKPVCRRDTQIIKGGGMMQHNQFAFRDKLNVPRQFFGKTAGKYFPNLETTF